VEGGQLEADAYEVQTVHAAVYGQRRIIGPGGDLRRSEVGRISNDHREPLPGRQRVEQRRPAKIDPIRPPGPAGVEAGELGRDRIDFDLNQVATSQHGGSQADVAHARAKLEDRADRRPLAQLSRPLALPQRPRARDQRPGVERDEQRAEVA